MAVLIACEESQSITKEFRALGIEAYSCDLLPCSGGHPEWHFKTDVLRIIKNRWGILENGEDVFIDKWEMMIAHPPCTYLSVAGAWAMYNKDGSINRIRERLQNEALDFVKQLMDSPIDRIAIENPISVIRSKIKKPDQIVHPYHFGHKASKSTCLWLKNLPLLKHTNVVEKGEFKEWTDRKTGKKKKQALWIYDILNTAKTKEERQTLRSKTFKGMAEAMAQQWGKLLNY